MNAVDCEFVVLLSYLMYCEKCSYSRMEIEIREFLATNTFAYAYDCLKRYVSNSIELIKLVDLSRVGGAVI